MNPIVYREDMQCVYQSPSGSQIRGRIFIGNLEAAQNLQTLKKNHIRAVITCAKGAFLQHTEEELPSYLYIPADDSEVFDLYQYFEKTSEFIDRNIPYTNVLVHCLAGVSRSVTIVIAHIMKKTGLSFSQVYNVVKVRRPIICPNSGFIAQLKKFQLVMSMTSKRENPQYHYMSPDRFNLQSRASEYFSHKKLPIDSTSIKKRQEYFQERFNELRNNLQSKRYASKSPIKNSDFYRSPSPKYRYESPGRKTRYDSFRWKFNNQKTDNMNRFLS